MNDRDVTVLGDILEAAQKIRLYTNEVDREAFGNETMRLEATLHQFMIIGEAAKRLSDATRDESSHIPWKSIAGMRNQLIHVYHDVDVDVVWRTAKNDVPVLIENVQKLLEP